MWMLRGSLIDLRPIAESDLALLEAWEADPDYDGEYNSFTLRHPGLRRRAHAEHGFLDDEQGKLLIVTKAGEPCGDISYRRVAYGPGVANRVYEIGITVAPSHRGRGYGTEAQRFLTAYLFATYPIARVQATTDITNVAEQRALERAGFTREGVLRQAQWRSGGWHGMVMYSKLRGE
jgi:aminoglycoside 6'-N-acetyltransferase